MSTSAAPEQPGAPIFVPVRESTYWFALSRDTLYRAAKRGEISIHKVGSRSLLKVAEVSDWIEGKAKGK